MQRGRTKRACAPGRTASHAAAAAASAACHSSIASSGHRSLGSALAQPARAARRRWVPAQYALQRA